MRVQSGMRRDLDRSELAVPRGTPLMGTRYDADAFGRGSEAIARFMGTGRFLAAQTVIVIGWILINTVGFIRHWDPYPFILLNLAFSLQAAYAAPLILLAQTRQADRDKAHLDADACHREELAALSAERQAMAVEQTTRLLVLMDQNTQLTQVVRDLSQRIETLTVEMHQRVLKDAG